MRPEPKLGLYGASTFPRRLGPSIFFEPHADRLKTSPSMSPVPVLDGSGSCPDAPARLRDGWCAS
jgi:hypothetical protein